MNVNSHLSLIHCSFNEARKAEGEKNSFRDPLKISHVPSKHLVLVNNRSWVSWFMKIIIPFFSYYNTVWLTCLRGQGEKKKLTETRDRVKALRSLVSLTLSKEATTSDFYWCQLSSFYFLPCLFFSPTFLFLGSSLQACCFSFQKN